MYLMQTYMHVQKVFNCRHLPIEMIFREILCYDRLKALWLARIIWTTNQNAPSSEDETNDLKIIIFRLANRTPSSFTPRASGAWRSTPHLETTRSLSCHQDHSSRAAPTTPSGSGTWITTWPPTLCTRGTSTRTSSWRRFTSTPTSTTSRRPIRPTRMGTVRRRTIRGTVFAASGSLTTASSWPPEIVPEISGSMSSSSWTSCARSRLTMRRSCVWSSVVKRSLSVIRPRLTHPEQADKSSKSTWPLKLALANLTC